MWTLGRRWHGLVLLLVVVAVVAVAVVVVVAVVVCHILLLLLLLLPLLLVPTCLHQLRDLSAGSHCLEHSHHRCRGKCFIVDTGAAFPTFAETKAALGSRGRRLCASNDVDTAELTAAATASTAGDAVHKLDSSGSRARRRRSSPPLLLLLLQLVVVVLVVVTRMMTMMLTTTTCDVTYWWYTGAS